MVLRGLAIGVFLLLMPLMATAQIDDAIEDWASETESEAAAADFSDMLLEFVDNPLNINDTASLSRLPFLSPFQLKALRNYIMLYGQLMSVNELVFVPGFDSSLVSLLAPLLKAEPFSTSSLGWKESLRKGRHTVVAGLGGTVEQAEGYRNGHYEGDNLHALVCYKFSSSHIDFRFSADKDPSEAWGKNNFYGYHLMLSDFGRLEKLVVGRYNLQFGQGVALWTGFSPFTTVGASPVRFAGGVKAAGPFYEQGYQEGVAATVRLGSDFHLSPFVSRHDGEWMGGAHLNYRRDNFIVGLTATATRLDDSVLLRDYAYNRDYFRGDRQAAVGLDALWQTGRFLFFGEVAVDHEGNPAGIGGLRLSAGGDNSFGITYRNYHPLYHNLYAGAYSIGETRNEKGLVLDARLRLPWRMEACLSADIHRFPSLRYGSYTPSSGTWLRAQLARRLSRHVDASLRYAWRQKERNVPNIDSTLYLGEETLRQQLQAQVRVEVGIWRFVTRACLSWFDPERSERQHGWLVAQEIRFTQDRWQVTLLAAWFDIDGYYARIYLSESNLQYAFSLPQLQGRGLRASAVVRFNVLDNLNLSLKYTLTAYPGEDHIGTGDAATSGPLRQTFHLQLRWKF